MNNKSEVIARYLANTMMLNGMFVEAEAEMEAKREYWKIEESKRQAEYRKSKEFRDIRAKKKAQRILRKKSQGR